MSHTVFFSWQTDTATRGGRNFIERALERAVRALSQDTTVEPAIRDLAVDRDTKGVSGQPPIVDTIFRKIDKAAVFVPDLTFIGHRPDGRPTPNPNVLIEYGWALKSLTYLRIVPVMNIAFGKPTAESMPFDMGHLRHPITYDCPLDLDEAGRKRVREQLTKDFEDHLRLVLESDEFRDSLPKLPEPPLYIAKQPADGRGRFKSSGEPIGIVQNFPGGVEELYLSTDPACWLRLMPTMGPGRTWSIDSLEKAMKAPVLLPLGPDWSGLGFVRNNEGFGTYGVIGKERKIASAVVCAFTSGEIWTVDTYWLQANAREERYYIPPVEPSFRNSLTAYGKFLQNIGVEPPYRWIAGMESLKGRDLYMPTPQGHMRVWPGPDGKCLVDVVCESGSYSPGDAPGPTLKPFFSKLYNSCGISRQDWQDV
jgi:hypothetical protein